MSQRRVWIVAALCVMSVTVALATGDDAASPDAFYQAIRTSDLAALTALIQQKPDLNAPDREGLTPLMHAAAFGSLEALKRLVDAGANVDAKSALGSTALMWCVRDIAKVRLLLDRGADVNVVSSLGRTPLLVAAMSDESAEVVRLLLARRADVRAVDKIGLSALHAATAGGDPVTIRLIVEAGADVNARDGAEYTPLMNAAANRSLAGVRLLLARGARVNDVSGPGDVKTHNAGIVKNGRLGFDAFTPLLLASANGSPEIVKALLDAGAHVNAKDGRGMTPLMLAVATDHSDPALVRLLLSRGADAAITSRSNETALDWAKKFGRTPNVVLLEKAGAPASVNAAPPVAAPSPVDLEPAVTRSIGLLEKTSGQFFAKGGCVACHSQNMTDVVGSVARGKRIHFDPKDAAMRLTLTRGRYATAIPHFLERQDTAGTPDVPLYSVLAMASAGHAPERATDAIAVNIAAQQARDGRWHFGGLARAPMADGDITRTALAIRALKVYAPPARVDITAQLDRAKAWLQREPAVTNEDRDFKLLGLRWADADDKLVARAAEAVLGAQRPDGGWAQRAELSSDAYATGQALYALAVAGRVRPDASAFQRGMRFLLSTQRADGSWHVASRSVKFQPYFESGFPYGEDQWISAMATGWSAAALAFAMPAAAAVSPQQR